MTGAIRKFIKFDFMLKKFLILIIILAISLWYWRGLNSPLNSESREQPFTVNQGETAEQIANNLKKDNLIRSVIYFKYYVRRQKLNLRAGEYSISPKLTAKELAKILTAGEALSRERAIRIIEGWNMKDINTYLNKNKIVPENSFISLANQEIRNLKFEIALDKEARSGLPPKANLEGFLFPDTYRIFKDATSEEIITKMLANFNKKLTPEMRAEIKRQKKTIYEIVTLASVIEKEVRSAEDMKTVSGIFFDRMKNGQALESCATLAYILGINKAQYTIEDTKINSPYNTYKYRGLPPGPIANPGLNAVTAAIYPEFTGYNYFLSDPATGKTIYSKTLEEHNINKYKYLK